MGDADKELMQLAALQAKASKKEAEFETRKRARLTEEFNSDKGQLHARMGLGPARKERALPRAGSTAQQAPLTLAVRLAIEPTAVR